MTNAFIRKFGTITKRDDVLVFDSFTIDGIDPRENQHIAAIEAVIEELQIALKEERRRLLHAPAEKQWEWIEHPMDDPKA